MGSIYNLQVWNRSYQLALKVYNITDKFPQKEKYRLTDQLCRAAISVPANIAEGRGRQTLKEFIQFLYIARGSLEEMKCHLLLAKDLNYINKKEFDLLEKENSEIGRMLNSFITNLKQKL